MGITVGQNLEDKHLVIKHAPISMKSPSNLFESLVYSEHVVGLIVIQYTTQYIPMKSQYL
jgi:hypothetical protein